VSGLKSFNVVVGGGVGVSLFVACCYLVFVWASVLWLLEISLDFNEKFV